MEVVVVVGVVTLVLVIVRAVRTRRQRAAALAAAGQEVPTFQVVALGPRGSGKPLLLASMSHQLQTQSGRGWFLTAPYEQVVLLNQWFTDVADPSRDWPAGTTVGETRDL